jgi:hypothetical protein
MIKTLKATMIDVYPTKVEARDENGQVLLTIELEDDGACTVHIKNPASLNQPTLSKVLIAMQRGVQILKIED